MVRGGGGGGWKGVVWCRGDAGASTGETSLEKVLLLLVFTFV